MYEFGISLQIKLYWTLSVNVSVKSWDFFIVFIYLFVYLFVCGFIGSPLLHAGFPQPWRAGATPHRGVGTPHCGRLPHCGAQAPGTQASVVVARRLSSCGSRAPELRLSSCGTRAQPLHSMWDPPGRGIKPVSPTLAGGLPTTAPPGKPQELRYFFRSRQLLWQWRFIFKVMNFLRRTVRNQLIFSWIKFWYDFQSQVTLIFLASVS